MKNASNQTFVNDFGEFFCGTIDLTNPAAYRWYKDGGLVYSSSVVVVVVVVAVVAAAAVCLFLVFVLFLFSTSTHVKLHQSALTQVKT